MVSLPLPAILLSHDLDVVRSHIKDDVRGPNSFTIQEIISSAFSPKISVVQTNAAREFISQYDPSISSMEIFLGYFELFLSENGYKVSFIGDILNKNELQNYDSWQAKNMEASTDNYILHVQKLIQQGCDKTSLENSIYLKYLAEVLSGDTITPYECINHPIIRLTVVAGDESLESVEAQLKEFEAYKIPKWFHKESMKSVLLILVDEDKPSMLENGLMLQESIGQKSLVMPVSIKAGTEVELRASVFGNWCNPIQLSNHVFSVWSTLLLDLISKEMMPFMQATIRQWTEDVVGPRRSLANRLFNAKKWSSSTKNSFFSFGRSSEDIKEEPAYNVNTGYYTASSAEMTIKKLGDWYLMLGDYKNSYTMYDLLKKDFTNDKAYLYFSTLQENIVTSLLLGASKRVYPFSSDGIDRSNIQSITSKMISDILNPSIDSAFYSYLSKYNLKGSTIKLVILTAELYFLLGQSMAYSNAQNRSLVLPNQSPSIYYTESITLFRKLIDSNLLGSTLNSLLMQRVAFVYYSYARPIEILSPPLIQDDYYEGGNPEKLMIPQPQLVGLQRTRKCILWMLLAARALDPNVHQHQICTIIEEIENEMKANPGEFKWLERDGGLLNKLKTMCDHKNTV